MYFVTKFGSAYLLDTNKSITHAGSSIILTDLMALGMLNVFIPQKVYPSKHITHTLIPLWYLSESLTKE